MSIAPLLAALLAQTPPVLAPPPAAAEPEVWALVARVNKPAAYQLYLERFPQGEHREAAVEAHSRLQGQPATYVPMTPPPITITPPPPLPISTDPCDALMYGQAAAKDPAEVSAFTEARRSNRYADYQAYLSRFPNGACRARATGILEVRAARALRLKPIPGLGPLAPHRLNPRFLDVEDYPAAALRAEEMGVVAAEWDVAADGVVENCRVTRSSGSASLDGTTCRLITARMRYDPARDSAGRVIRSADRMTVGWTLPAD